MAQLQLLAAAAAAALATAGGDAHDEPPSTTWALGPPAPPWRNDSANVEITASLNEYLALVSWADDYDGDVTDARPISLAWSVVGDMPHALKDGVACWVGPTAAFPEGEVLIAGGLWPTGIAHSPSLNEHLNRSLSYDVATKRWRDLPLPPYVPARTQGACLANSLIIISGGDGSTVGSRVMRLSKATPTSDWAWDTRLPALSSNASRFLAAAHSIGDRWLVLALGSPTVNEPVNKVGALVPWRLDLQAQPPRWEATSAYPAAATKAHQHIELPISAAVGGKLLVFGGQYGTTAAATAAWSKLPADIAAMTFFGPRPSTTTVDARQAFAYDPESNTWEALPKLPKGFIAGPKHAPVVAGRYVLLLGSQQRLTARRGKDAPGTAVLDGFVSYYGDDVLFYDSVERKYGTAGKMIYGVCTASFVSNGTHALGFGGEPTHWWNGNTESAVQLVKVRLDA